MIETIKPRWIIAQHYNTYRTNQDNAFWTRGYPAELRDQISETLQDMFNIPKAGDIYLFDPGTEAD